MQKILIIEDEPGIADNLVYALKTEQFNVHWERLAEDGYSKLTDWAPDLVILDVGLPDTNGFELCKRIRKTSQVPIIFLTARTEEVDRIVGLEIGGDDYVTKPFSPREVVARVKVILRRTSTAQNSGQDAMEKGFLVEEEKARISYQNKLLELTRYEYLLLKTLLSQPERVFSRAQLMDKVWTEPTGSFERSVDTHIKTLRAKLRDVDENLNPIKTHRGLGYSCTLE
ncbi:MAG: two-component system response regulator CreB [Gammaproteobacteria bacterium]|nr:two-component system response regulator CreB [Gammaproteobacteria bacterium]NNC97926.1 two-component system response regulator CreB [Gammaproteobacteria bacterium]NNM14276.1 two-component system response regulator CreB [Gammaproteobacteria bacterium]